VTGMIGFMKNEPSLRVSGSAGSRTIPFPPADGENRLAHGRQIASIDALLVDISAKLGGSGARPHLPPSGGTSP